MSLSAGAKLGAFEIVAAIGAGGMGEVYKARDTRLDRIVAIKVLPAALASDPEFRERFNREARIISQFEHPHICTLYDVGKQEGTAYLVMEYLEGETLADRLTRGALRLDQAMTIAIDLTDALAAAHRAGITHRDFKPGNVFLTKSGAKLLDFGLAKTQAPLVAGPGASMLPTTPPHLTAQGTILGTFQYMAPEQLEGQEADPRTDIFAFGAVLYEMITGKKAFEGKTQASLIAAILEREPTPLPDVQPRVPPNLDHLVRRCLAKDPDKRWQSAADVSIELRWVAESSPTAVVSSASSSGRVRLWQSLSVVLPLLIAAGWAVTARRAGPAPAPSEPIVFSVPPPEGATFVTRVPGQLPWFALSPDSSVLAFVALSADGRQQLWTRSLRAVTAHALADTDGAQAPFWSPDSRFLAFFSRGKLKVIDVAGGRTQIVADAPGLFGSGSWNRENTIIFAPTPGDNDGLRKVQVGASNADELVTRVDRSKEQHAHFLPQFLPDGRHFLFGVRSDFGTGEAQTWIGSLDGGEPHLVLRADAVAKYAAPGYLLFKRGLLFAQRVDGPELRFLGEPVRLTDLAVGSNAPTTYLALSTSTAGSLVYAAPFISDGETRLVWKDRNGQTLDLIDVTSTVGAPSLSRDGTMMVMARRLPQTGQDLWLYDVKRTSLMRFTFGAAQPQSPIWSPDGKFVVFSTVAALYRKSTTGSGPEELIAKAPSPYLSDWSADGRFILFQTPSSTERQRTGWDLWLASVGDRQLKPLVQTVFTETQGALSPDGRRLAYTSDESGAFEVYVQAFPDGVGKQIVSSGGGAEPRWRADGRELFYISADRRLMAVPTTIGPTFDAEKPHTLFQTSVFDLAFPFTKRYDVTADGQRFVVQELTARHTGSALTVVLNWPALLTKER